MRKTKYYVVWEGYSPGVYDSWEECRLQVEGYKGAKYKAFDSQIEAVEAFRGSPSEHLGILKQLSDYRQSIADSHTATNKVPRSAIINNSLAVDAACSGNPGRMEYRGVYVATGVEVFKIGPLEQGTNNIGEFLALVHGLALLKKMGNNMPIYSDSRNAMLWVKQKKCKTQLSRNEVNAPIFDLIERAEAWLHNNEYSTEIIKWETDSWGEIPADFGRK
ncbi:MAG: ribonuclease H family protein [Bacteroidaceae bacterium]|nr:ribonuclease H family protein [Bacteroidaceae bacterium]